jgi:hypothetical protein
MNADLKCTQPERWAKVPDFEATDNEILMYLEHVEHCPLHSMLENRKLQIVKEDFQTARELAPNRLLPLSPAAQDNLLDKFEKYLKTREDPRHVQALKPPQRLPKSRKLWFPSFKQAVLATSLIAAGIITFAIWKLVYRVPIPVAPVGGSPGPESASVTPSPAPPAISINDAGGIIELDHQGNLRGLPTDVSQPNVEAIHQALKEGRIFFAPVPRELQRQSEQRMGAKDSAGLTLVSPVQRIVLSATPTFRWNALKEATSYTVSVYDEQGNLVTSNDSLNATIWKLPKGKRLARGQVYSWEVTAIKDSEEITSKANFKVLEKSKTNEIMTARKQYPRFHLLLGIVYARVGLIHEAEAEFREVFRANPKSDIAQRIMQSIEGRREVKR